MTATNQTSEPTDCERTKSKERTREEELRAVWWELALAWRLYDAAVRERRLEDAHYHARQREFIESRARILLDMVPRGP